MQIGSASAAARPAVSSRCSPTLRARPSGPVETGTRGSGGDRTLVIDHSAEDLVFAELDRLHEQGYRFLRPLGGARRDRLRRRQRAGDHRSDRRLAQRQARHPPPRAVDRRRRRPDDGRRRVRLRARLRARARSGGRAAARAPGSTASSSTTRWASAAATTGASRCSASSRPTRAGWPPRRATLCSCCYRIRALGTIAASLCQVAAARFDGMVSLRRSRGRRCRGGAADRARGGRPGQLPGLRGPARSAAGRHPELAGGRRPHARDAAPPRTRSRRDRLDPGRADRRLCGRDRRRPPPDVDLAALAAHVGGARDRLHRAAPGPPAARARGHLAPRVGVEQRGRHAAAARPGAREVHARASARCARPCRSAWA